MLPVQNKKYFRWGRTLSPLDYGHIQHGHLLPGKLPRRQIYLKRIQEDPFPSTTRREQRLLNHVQRQQTSLNVQVDATTKEAAAQTDWVPAQSPHTFHRLRCSMRSRQLDRRGRYADICNFNLKKVVFWFLFPLVQAQPEFADISRPLTHLREFNTANQIYVDVLDPRETENCFRSSICP